MVYIQNGILLSHKENEIPFFYSNIDGPRSHHTKWSKSEVKWSKSLSCVPFFATPRTTHYTGVGSLSLIQGIFPTQGSNPGLSHSKQILYQLSHKGSKSEKDKYHMISLRPGIQNMTQTNLFTKPKRTHRHRKQTVSKRERGWKRDKLGA